MDRVEQGVQAVQGRLIPLLPHQALDCLQLRRERGGLRRRHGAEDDGPSLWRPVDSLHSPAWIEDRQGGLDDPNVIALLGASAKGPSGWTCPATTEPSADMDSAWPAAVGLFGGGKGRF